MDRAAVQGLFDRSAATYDIAAFPFFTPFGEALAEFAHVRPGERVLDVGCGTGAALAAAARVAGGATGIELSPAMAERARAAAPGVEVIVGDASSLPFESGSFDLVLSSFVVFFMDDPTAALREWSRVLAPAGRIAMATWCSGDPRWSWERSVRMPYAQRIEPSRLAELMRGVQQLARFDEPEKVEAELCAAGLRADQIERHAIDFVFAQEQDWWDWNWSHGSRVFLEALPEEDREGFRRAAFEAMQANREGDGFPRTYTALFTRASA